MSNANTALAFDKLDRALALHEDEASVAESPLSAPPAATAATRGGLTPVAVCRPRVLIVDDEPHLLKAFQRILRSTFEVVVAEGGREGLAILSQDPRFDAVLCDLAMPDLDGASVYAALLESAPSLASRMLFCTGGACSTSSRDFLRAHSESLLEKPVDPDELRVAVAAVCARL